MSKKKLQGSANKNKPKFNKKTISCFYKGNKTNHKILSFICHESKMELN